jgi:CheY-like chemotaxis protein
MFAKYWNVLVVDDEPDVISITKLALRNCEVYGEPITVHAAGSKAEAIELLQGPLMRQGGYANLTVAFVDVVMETDTAGLELCHHIREVMRNSITSVFIRTGQPGLAPERSVIDRYDISGYFTKAEATEEKLYSLVKSGVRQFLTAGVAGVHFEFLHQLSLASGSRERLSQVLMRLFSSHKFDANGKPVPGLRYRRWVMTEDQVLPGGELEEEAHALRERLNRMPGMPLGNGADKLVIDGLDVLIKVAASPDTSEMFTVMSLTHPMPAQVASVHYRFLRAFSSLWLKAGVPAAPQAAAVV